MQKNTETSNTKETVGAKALKARSDSIVYDPLEIGHAMTEDILSQIEQCIENHNNIINEDEYCIVMVLADDPLIKGVLRRKFYAWLYLPSPRPRQAVFLYNKKTNYLSRLWVLPDPATMSILTETPYVAKKWEKMRNWSFAFFRGCFWEYIRKENKIDMLSESEYLKANREKLIKSGCKPMDSNFSEPFDFSKVCTYKVVDS